MLADPQTMNDGVTNHSMTRVGYMPNGMGSLWRWEGSTPALTKEMTIRRENAGNSIAPGSDKVQRFNVQLVSKVLNTTLGKTEKLTTNVTFTVDPGTTLDAAKAILHFAMLVDLLVTDGQLDDILLGEI